MPSSSWSSCYYEGDNGSQRCLLVMAFMTFRPTQSTKWPLISPACHHPVPSTVCLPLAGEISGYIHLWLPTCLYNNRHTTTFLPTHKTHKINHQTTLNSPIMFRKGTYKSLPICINLNYVKCTRFNLAISCPECEPNVRISGKFVI